MTSTQIVISAQLKHIISSDGLTLQLRYWLPSTTPKSAVAFVHGQSDHSGRYQHVGSRLAAAGHALFVIDLRGHGGSPGKRGHISSIDDYLLDMVAMRYFVDQTLTDMPVFAGGHSMGGVVALASIFDQQEKWAGVILSAPWLKLAFEPPRWQTMLSGFAARVLPSFTVNNGLDPASFSHDAAVVQAYQIDPQSHSQISARAYDAIRKAQQIILAQAADYTLPVLIQQGEADPVVNWHINKAFFDDLGSTDKTLHTYPDLFHEIYNELDNDQIFIDLIAWLNQHS